MRDEDKTKEQLIEELRELRTCVARLDGRRTEKDPRENEEACRVKLLRLQALARRLLEVQETERHRLARELHDGICQDLTSLAFAFEAAAIAPPETFEAKMSEARDLLAQAMSQVRELSFDLRPGLLDHLGLLPALRKLIERYTTSSGVRVNFNHSGVERRFAPELETAAYRMVQEALTNVARHAQVREATVRVWVDGETLEIQIEDAGVGFDAEAVMACSRSNSLTGMRERAMLLGGRLVVESTPGGGTHLLVELPLNVHDGSKINEHFHRLGR